MTPDPSNHPPDGPTRSSGAASAPAGTDTAARPPACLDSAVLLQGQGSVAITHHGVIYRLQSTRQGKLILTK